MFSNPLSPNIPVLFIVFRVGGGGLQFPPFSSSAALFRIVPPSIPLRPLCITGRSVKAKINDKSIALVSGVDTLATAWRPCFVCTLLCYGNLMVRATENDDDKFLNECVLGFGGRRSFLCLTSINVRFLYVNHCTSLFKEQASDRVYFHLFTHS